MLPKRYRSESGLGLLPLTPQQLKLLATKPVTEVRQNFASFPRTPELNAFYPKSQLREKTLLSRKRKIAQNFLGFINSADHNKKSVIKNSPTFFKDNANKGTIDSYQNKESPEVTIHAPSSQS